MNKFIGGILGALIYLFYAMWFHFGHYNPETNMLVLVIWVSPGMLALKMITLIPFLKLGDNNIWFVILHFVNLASYFLVGMFIARLINKLRAK